MKLLNFIFINFKTYFDLSEAIIFLFDIFLKWISLM